jgi:hypothetical protein
MAESKSLHAKLSRVQLATMSDFDAITATMERANEYAAARNGEQQWTVLSFVHGQLRNHIDVDEGFVIKDEQQRVEMFVVLSQEDPYMWGDEGSIRNALYIHKFMKDPTIAQPGDGLLMIAFAAQEAIRRSKKFLRCDVKVSMVRLVDYYIDLGFGVKRDTTYQTTGQAAHLLEADPSMVLERVAGRLG